MEACREKGLEPSPRHLEQVALEVSSKAYQPLIKQASVGYFVLCTMVYSDLNWIPLGEFKTSLVIQRVYDVTL